MNFLHKKPVFVGLVITFLSASVNADVTLNVEDNIKVMAINGTSVNTSMFRDPKMQYTMAAGTHVITARYDRFYKLRGDNHDYLKSSNITISGLLEDNQTYQLAMIDQPEKYEEAKKYVDSPILAIKQGSQIIARKELVPGSDDSIGLQMIGSMFGFGKNQAALDNTKVITAVNTATPRVQTVSTTVPITDTLDTFMQLWLQATPAEREKMRTWIEE